MHRRICTLLLFVMLITLGCNFSLPRLPGRQARVTQIHFEPLTPTPESGEMVSAEVTSPAGAAAPADAAAPAATATKRPTATQKATSSAPPALKSLILTDPAFDVDYQGECNTDIKITEVNGTALSATGTISLKNGQFTMWCYGAKHTWVGRLTYQGFTFDSNASNPLSFIIDPAKGYVYTHGIGTVTEPDGTTHVMGDAAAAQPTETDAEAVQEPEKTSASPFADWTVQLTDSFDNNKHFWTTGKDTSATSKINHILSGGKMTWELSATDNNLWWDTIVLDSADEFYVSIEGKHLEGPNANSDYGVVFRRADNRNLCYFTIDNYKDYAVFCLVHDNWETLIDWSETTWIKPSQVNVIGVHGAGSHYTFYINDHEIDSVAIPKARGNTFGFSLNIYEAGNVKAEFDNFIFMTP